MLCFYLLSGDVRISFAVTGRERVFSGTFGILDFDLLS